MSSYAGYMVIGSVLYGLREVRQGPAAMGNVSVGGRRYDTVRLDVAEPYEMRRAFYASCGAATIERIRDAFRAAGVTADNPYHPDHCEGHDRPRVVCLCGSTRFKAAYAEQMKQLTHAGCIVLTVGDLDQSAANANRNVPIDPQLKSRLDTLHLRKIDMSDEVLILNVGGYIGESTQRELDYARRTGKAVRFLEDCQPIPPQ